MTTYSVPIYRKQGGSELVVGAAGSVVNSGLLTTQDGGSFTFVTPLSGTAFRFDIGGSTPSIGAGPNVPTHTAVPGSLYIRANGSMGGLFVNIGQDNASSSWRAFQQGSAIG